MPDPFFICVRVVTADASRAVQHCDQERVNL